MLAAVLYGLVACATFALALTGVRLTSLRAVGIAAAVGALWPLVIVCLGIGVLWVGYERIRKPQHRKGR